MSASMVVVPEPAVKGGGAFCACAVDGAVGPAVEHGADEALGFAVGLGAARSSAEVADAERLAGEGVDGGDVGAAIVGEYALDVDAVSSCSPATGSTPQSPERAASRTWWRARVCWR